MKRYFFLTPLVFLLIVNTSDSSETLDILDIDTLTSQIGFLESDDIAIDLNEKITIPPNVSAGLSGVDLYATIFRHTRPAAPADSMQRPFARPTILVVTPYRRCLMVVPYLKLLDADYNIISVDIRGTGSSEGSWLSFAPEEHYDLGYIIDHFIPEQAWSDQTVGMIGLSYEGISQILAAGQVESENGIPKHLKAVFPLVPMSDVYRDIVMHGGNMDMEFIPFWMGIVDVLSVFPPTLFLGSGEPFRPSLDDIQTSLEIWETHRKNIRETLGWIADIDHVDKGDFFDTKSTMIYWPDKPDGGWQFGDEYPADLGKTVIPENLPFFMVGGWFDIFTRGTINTWEYGLKNHAQTDKRMIIGPWYHLDGALGLQIKGLLSCDIAARWFDWKIKGTGAPIMEDYPVLTYIMGEEKWRAEKAWPLAGDRIRKEELFLSKQKASVLCGDWFSLLNAPNNYRLTHTPGDMDYSRLLFKRMPVPIANPVLRHDPGDLHGLNSRSSTRWCMGLTALVPIISKYFFNRNIDDKMPWEDERLDEIGVLTFTTDELDEDLEITGPMTLTFWAKTRFSDPLNQFKVDALLERLGETRLAGSAITHFIDKRDVQWVIEANDVFPDGRARNITSGWLSAENRPFDPADPSQLDPAYIPFDPFYDHAYKTPSPIEEDQVYPYVIELWPTANVFKKGHRLRISISASDFPHLFPVFRASTNTLVIDPDHQASLSYIRVISQDNTVWVENPTSFILDGKR